MFWEHVSHRPGGRRHTRPIPPFGLEPADSFCPNFGAELDMAARCRRRSHPSKTAASASLSTACGSAGHIEGAVRCAVPIRPSDGRQPHEPISHADRNDSLGGGPTGGSATPQFRVKTRRSVRLWYAMQEREKNRETLRAARLRDAFSHSVVLL